MKLRNRVVIYYINAKDLPELTFQNYAEWNVILNDFHDRSFISMSQINSVLHTIQ